jgi:hypothetical protein
LLAVTLEGTPVAGRRAPNYLERELMNTRTRLLVLALACCPAAFSACRSSNDGGLLANSTDAEVVADAGVDVRTVEDSPRDTMYTMSPDGHRLAIVDYCLPVLPLSSKPKVCPTSLDEATTAVDAGQDASSAFISECAEGLVVYSPYGWTLGWSVVCYYDPPSRALVAALAGTDTPTECTGSPEANTAAFVAQVYGRMVVCSPIRPLGIDASTVD